MPNRLALTVPEPCHESWAAMTPTARGRHCAACNKVVLDFTHKTDAEILAALRHAAAPCGRFRPDQLNRPLVLPAAAAPRWRTWLAAAAAVLGLRELAAEQSHGQQQRQPAVPHQYAHDARKVEALRRPAVPAVPSADTTTGIVRGRVVDANTGEGLPGATVLLVGTQTGVATAADGTFVLETAGTRATQISFSSIGYVMQTHNLAHYPDSYAITLTPDLRQLGGLVVVGVGISAYHPWYTPRGLWQRVSRPFRRW